MLMTLHERLREVRQLSDLTLSQVAAATRLSASYISDLERGRTNPSLDTIERLAACYKMQPIDLLSGVDEWGSAFVEQLAPGLDALVQEGKIDPDEARDLNRITLRGKQPQTEDEWLFLYLSLKQILKAYWKRLDSAAKPI